MGRGHDRSEGERGYNEGTVKNDSKRHGRSQRTGYWLRWWTADDSLLLWGDERVEQEWQWAEQERQRAESVQAAAIFKLLDLGLSVEQVGESLGLPVEVVKQFRQT
ncbi:MAG: hypothetical protein AAF152_17385 [Cyanobacteria bacterium P01_A01_bin.114]